MTDWDITQAFGKERTLATRHETAIAQAMLATVQSQPVTRKSSFRNDAYAERWVARAKRIRAVIEIKPGCDAGFIRNRLHLPPIRCASWLEKMRADVHKFGIYYQQDEKTKRYTYFLEPQD